MSMKVFITFNNNSERIKLLLTVPLKVLSSFEKTWLDSFSQLLNKLLIVMILFGIWHFLGNFLPVFRQQFKFFY